MTFGSPMRYIICIDRFVKKNSGRFEQFTGALKFAQNHRVKSVGNLPEAVWRVSWLSSVSQMPERVAAFG